MWEWRPSTSHHTVFTPFWGIAVSHGHIMLMHERKKCHFLGCYHHQPSWWPYYVREMNVVTFSWLNWLVPTWSGANLMASCLLREFPSCWLPSLCQPWVVEIRNMGNERKCNFVILSQCWVIWRLVPDSGCWLSGESLWDARAPAEVWLALTASNC